MNNNSLVVENLKKLRNDFFNELKLLETKKQDLFSMFKRKIKEKKLEQINNELNK